MNSIKRPQRGEPVDTPLDRGQLPFDSESEPDQTVETRPSEGGAIPPPPTPGLTTTGQPSQEPDPFDLSALRLSQDFASAVGVKKLIVTVPVRKPSKEWFVRTHPDPSYRLQTAGLELKEDREMYLVSHSLWGAMSGETTFSPRLLVTTINRQGVLFLWPVRLPGPDGRIDDWSRSALDAIREAESRWVRITANMSLGAYDVSVSPNVIATPSWPDLDFGQIIKIAFRDKMISDPSHPVLQRLRGEV